MGYASTTQFTYDLGAIMRRFGQDYHPGGAETSTAWRVGYVGKLIERHGFPAPLPGLGEDPLRITQRSRWTIPSVDKWFEDRDPDGTAAADVRAQAAGASVMDQRAAAIGREITGRNAAPAAHRKLRMVDGARA